MIWAIVIVAVALAAFAAFYTAQRQRSRQLRTHFGPEYDRAVRGYGERRAAERALEERADRVKKLEIRPLPALQRDELAREWETVQARFVDDPGGAIAAAHRLLATVMHERGYPTGRPAEEIDLLSVHHPGAVQHYRAALELAAERDRGNGETEDLRQALIHYRALFDDLLHRDDGAARAPKERS